MKKFMLRGREKHSYADAEYMPKSLEYGVWYELITPFGWWYVKLKKGSRQFEIYDFMSDKKPIMRLRRKGFLNLITSVKSPIEEPIANKYYPGSGVR